MLGKFLRGFRGLVKVQAQEEWDLGERRKLIRLRCHYDVKAETNGKKFDAQIMDMGLKGLRLRCFEPLKPGQEVKVVSPIPIVGSESDDVLCKVVWIKQPERNLVTFAGMVYSSDERTMARSWVKYFLKELGFTKDLIFSQRQHVRAECFVLGKLSTADGTTHKARVYNLGVGGALVEVPLQVEMGSVVMLQAGPHNDLPVFVAAGKVVYRKPSGKLFMLGVEFGDLAASEVGILGRYLRSLLKSQWAE